MANKDWNVEEIRKDFPLLMKGDLAYLDNAATSQKPLCVLEAEKNFYENYNANPFRGLYELSEEATQAYEDARVTVQHFLNAKSEREIIFTRNSTESLNLAAFSLGELLLEPGDEIVVSILEHHSNFLPWMQAAKRVGAHVRFLECDAQGQIDPWDVEKMITAKTKIVTLTHISNVLGVKNDLKRIAGICHAHGVVLVADGAQSTPHIRVDVQDLDVDFLVLSGHKMLAPTGIGALYGKEKWLEKMPPFLTGGEMIETVTRERATWAELPHKFEAGTVNTGGAVALAEAIRYLDKLGFDWIEERERELTVHLIEGLRSLPHVRVLGDEDPENHHGIVTFAIDGVHPHDIAAILDEDHIAVRAGHHCAQPLHQHLGVPSTTRASLAFYNTVEETDRLIESVSQIRRKMGFESDVL